MKIYENMSLALSLFMKTRAGMCLFDLQIGLSKTTVTSSDQLLVLVNPWDYHTVPNGASYSSVGLNMLKSCLHYIYMHKSRCLMVAYIS